MNQETKVRAGNAIRELLSCVGDPDIASAFMVHMLDEALEDSFAALECSRHAEDVIYNCGIIASLRDVLNHYTPYGEHTPRNARVSDTVDKILKELEKRNRPTEKQPAKRKKKNVAKK
jgi:hypothetical protein